MREDATISEDLTLRNRLFARERVSAEYQLLTRTYRKRGRLGAVRLAASIASVYARQALISITRSAAVFAFDGERLPYLRHWHVTTFLNERTVEVPIVVRQLERRRPERLLEIGNVLGYYVRYPRVVVDKYEVARGVSNIDVVDFRAAEPFDMIVSVSTLEHVGWDETPRDPEKTVRAVRHLRTLLAPGGCLVCTFPLGYNPRLDEHLAAGRLPFDEVRYLRRVNARNEWQEAPAAEVAGSEYGRPFMHANALGVGFAFAPSGSEDGA